MTKEQKERAQAIMDVQGCGCDCCPRTSATEKECEELLELVPSLDQGEDDLHWDAYCFLRESGFNGLAHLLLEKRPPKIEEA